MIRPDLSGLSPNEKIELLRLLEARARLEGENRMARMYPEEGRLSRHAYPKHMEFFRAGAKYRERGLIAGNRTGKTLSSCYETALHATGLYPPWWEGKVFPERTEGWVAGKTNDTTRDILQATLFGKVCWDGPTKTVDGTGLIPRASIGRMTWKVGVADLLDTVQIKHKSGDWSMMGFKSYSAGRGSFEGTAKHYIALDEEPPSDIYDECLIRTATTDGVVYATFTPLEGATDVVLKFLSPELLSTLKAEAERANRA